MELQRVGWQRGWAHRSGPNRQPNLVKYIAIVLLALWVAGTADHAVGAKDTPYVLAKKSFKKQVKTVALSPLQVPAMFELSAEMRDFIESEASAALAKTKIDNLGGGDYRSLQAIFSQRVGSEAAKDEAADARRERIVRDHTRREVRRRHDFDGFAEVSLVAVSATFSDDKAEWDGVKRKVKSSGDGFSLFGGKNYQGTIAGVSFQLAIYDRNDTLLYLNRGGIDVLQARQGEHLVMRTDDYLSDTKRLKRAVRMAFKPL